MSDQQFVAQLLEQLQELEERLIPTGLHVLDDGLAAPDDVLQLAAEHHDAATITRLREQLEEEPETEAILAALRGQYISPSSGGDVIRNPGAVPTGRNLHGLNPALVPNRAAVAAAGRTVAALLERAVAETGAYPESIGMVLWGTDNLKTDGEAIAQVLLLIGVEPKVDDLGRVHDVSLIPLAQLARPRIDVVVTASGIFRDLFANHLELLDRAFHLVASADEPLDQNFVRKHALAIAAELEIGPDDAAARIFSNAPG
ncbi:MAG TPA: cobaltochelatase subunit CobN, partial [Chloroflexota bacterium]|nr:cobaltochelatase subunit CobN [Chloroflexota bacterium]